MGARRKLRELILRKVDILGSIDLRGIPLSSNLLDTEIYYVDAEKADTNDGEGWETAFASIQAAVDRARYVRGTTTIDYDDKRGHRLVLVAPGHYNENVLYSGYNIHVIGMGPAVPGKDYGVSLNYDGAIDETAVYLISGSGNSLQHVHLYCAAAIPALWIYNGDNNLVEDVVIECDGTLCTYGVIARSLKGSWLRDLVIINPITAGIFADGDADRYCINGGIERCQMIVSATGGKGIFIENTMTAYNFRIYQNFIDILAAGATAKGIDNDASGNVIIADNYVVCHASASPIESAGKGSLHNHVSKNGTVTDPFDDD